MDRLLTGIGDGCENCLSTPNTWSDISAIDAGFEKNQQGIGSIPLRLRETFSFTATHKVIHGLD